MKDFTTMTDEQVIKHLKNIPEFKKYNPAGTEKSNLRNKRLIVHKYQEGFAIMKDSAGEYTLYMLYVSPEYRNQGIAGEIVRELMDVYDDGGGWPITLQCSYYLISFYERLGFRLMGNESDEVIMQADL